MASIESTPAGTFRVHWRENGRPKSKNKKTEAEAQAFKDQVERRLAEGKLVMRRSDVPTLQEFAEKWLASRVDLSDESLATYSQQLDAHVLPFLGHLPLVDLRPRRLGAWQEQRLEEGAGPAVLGKTQKVLGQILRKAVLPHEYLDHNPVDALDLPCYKKKNQRWLTAGEVEGLRLWFLERDDPLSAFLLSVLAYVGIRPQSALARLRSDFRPEPPGWVRHVAPGSGCLTVDTKDVNGRIVQGSKTGKQAFVYVPAPVLADLALLPVGLDLLFPDKQGEPWTKSKYQSWSNRLANNADDPGERGKNCFKRAAEETGLGSKVTPYHLRHTAATLYAAAGWNHIEVARQLMHGPEVSASTYQHLFDERPPEAQKFTVEDFIEEARGVIPDRRIVAERS